MLTRELTSGRRGERQGVERHGGIKERPGAWRAPGGAARRQNIRSSVGAGATGWRRTAAQGTPQLRPARRCTAGGVCRRKAQRHEETEERGAWQIGCFLSGS